MKYALLLFIFLFAEIIWAQNCDRYSDCAISALPSTLKAAVSSCELEQKMKDCQSLINPPDIESIDLKSCRPVEVCRRQGKVDQSTPMEKVGACFYGVIRFWKQAIERRHESVRLCEKDLSCKVAIAKKIPLYSKLKPEEVEKMSAAFLIIEAEKYEHITTMAQQSSAPKRFLYDLAVEAEERQSRRTDVAESNTPDFIKIYDNMVKALSGWMKDESARYSCLTPEALTELWCARLSQIAPAGTIITHTARGMRLARGLERRSSGSPRIFRSADRQIFVNQYATREFASESQNRKWMQIADQTTKSEKVRFLDIENSQLKHLNDTTKDKDFVTALTNKNKEIVFRKVDELKKKFPGLEITPYSDFKSTRFAISGNIPKNLDSELQRLFRDANSEFSDFMLKSNLIRKDDLPQNWFRAGLGDTADEASSAARFSRQRETNELSRFSDPEAQKHFKETLAQAESTRTQISSQLAHTNLLEGASGQQVLRADVFDVVRKSNTNDGLRESFQKIYGVSISDAQATQLRSYTSLVDQMQPGIHVARREFANLTNSPTGGISADFAGMGAANLQGTARAMAQSRSIDEALVLARQQEKRVTQEFLQKKERFERDVNNFLSSKKKMDGVQVTCSGDDCVVVTAKSLDQKTKQELVQRLSRNDQPAGMRVAFVGDHVTDSSVRNQLASHGESLEKILRQRLQGQLPQDKLRQVLFSVDMKGTQLGQGQVQLIVGNSRTQLTRADRDKIDQAFQAAIQDLNGVLAKNKVYGSYHP